MIIFVDVIIYYHLQIIDLARAQPATDKLQPLMEFFKVPRIFWKAESIVTQTKLDSFRPAYELMKAFVRDRAPML
jgi:hypothetical protein